ncbi:hypothetical protein SAMN04488691_11230 [Haloferax larsenii]|uniref:Uncharacterized protein n=1 Tax=Haloferax larsenii TaxID=302484 RepID=A0A1H7UCK9_HALLR|nr:hypothetical protein SAMN04488691_11230 [Haloferax larsenii]
MQFGWFNLEPVKILYGCKKCSSFVPICEDMGRSKLTKENSRSNIHIIVLSRLIKYILEFSVREIVVHTRII